jgi:hypothetical protein
MLKNRIHWIVLPVILSLGLAGAARAQDSADQLLEKARAKAAEIEKLKKIINEEPDQNVRLAAFDLMVNKGDSVMRDIAIDAGIASADSLMQAAAFKAAFMELDRLHLTLVADPDAAEKMRDLAQAYINKNGDQYVLKFKQKDAKQGTVKGSSLAGEIIGTRFTYTYGYGSGELALQDDDGVSGDITLRDGNNMLKFSATAKIR